MQLFVNDLTVIDFSYLCHRRGVVGESWIVDVLLTGDLNDQSMVLDFSIVKKQIKFIIDEAVDHKLLLPCLDSGLTVTDGNSDNHQYIDFINDRGNLYLQSPNCAFAHIQSDEITIDSVTKHLTNIIMEQMPANVKALEIKLRPEVLPDDYYHYTHGLKKHDGNCQRIAHGHRSPIHIYIDDKRDQTLEAYWCNRWRDIYIATDEDEVSLEQIQLSITAKEAVNKDYRFFAYSAPQGRFDIAVQQSQLEILDCDSTVELIADYIARQLKLQQPENKVSIVAFEGVGKGAIANA